MSEPFYQYLQRQKRYFFTRINTRLMRPHFRQLKSSLDPRVEVKNPEYISIGANVLLRPYVWLYAVKSPKLEELTNDPVLELEDGCWISRFAHIVSAHMVRLEPYVIVAEGVLITDCNHGYEDISLPIMKQPLNIRGPVIIGAGSNLGNGSRIIGKVSIGRNCTIGANTIVTHDVPDYCVVIGNPARIIRRFDTEKQRWVHMNVALGTMQENVDG